MEGYSTCRITIGTRSVFIPEDERKIPELTHEWKAYIKAPKDVIKTVQFKLHESFSNNVVVTKYPFEITERGWGEFTIQLKIVLMNGDKVLTSHFLKLHGEGDTVTNERVDELVFKEPEMDVSTSVSEEEAEEYGKIDNAITKVLKMFKDDSNISWEV